MLTQAYYLIQSPVFEILFFPPGLSAMQTLLPRISDSREGFLKQSTSLLLLDIIVQLEDGSIANVEIQKIPYTFPGERMSCYSADLLLRQYTRVKGEKGSTFTYQDLKTVYTIVMFENSPKECKDPELSDIYLHGYV